jgi:hypothetical protein
MPAALLHFSSFRRSQHNYVMAMPVLKFQQNLRQNHFRDLAVKVPRYEALAQQFHAVHLCLDAASSVISAPAPPECSA